MTLPGFVLRNTFRNPRRTILTMMSIGVSMALVVILRTLVTEILRPVDYSAALPRLVVRHRTSLGLPLPVNYGAKIQRLTGVKAITPLNWFGGQYKDERFENFFPRFACDPETFFEVFTDYKVPDPEQRKAFLRERTACLVGKELLTRFKWKIGDRFRLTGDIYPVDLDLTIRGTLEGPDPNWCMFNIKYLEEAMGTPARIGSFFVLAQTIDDVPRLIEQIDTMFRNSDAETKSETEKAFQLSFVSMLGNIQFLIGSIVSVVVFAILLVAASTMAMAVRERTRELAVLKTLGFQRGALLVMVVVEGMLVSLGGGALGIGGAWLFLPRPKWFLAILAGGAVLTILSIIGILSGVLLPEHHPGLSEERLSARLQGWIWRFGPWVSGAGALLAALGVIIFSPPLTWYQFSSGFFPGMNVTPHTLLLSALITLGVGIFSSIFPAWNASRISVVDGLRNLG